LFSTYVVHSASALAASGESHDSEGEDSVEFEPPAATVLSSVVSVDSLASRLSRCLTNVTIDHLISTYVPPRAPVHLPAPILEYCSTRCLCHGAGVSMSNVSYNAGLRKQERQIEHACMTSRV